jgi:hypothetical protein
MYDQRQYPDRYDLYRPTTAISATGERTRTIPETPTLAGARGRFIDGGGKLEMMFEGLNPQHHARLRLPKGADLRPSSRGEAPDRIVLTKLGSESVTRTFIVTSIMRHGNQTLTAHLREVE